ncbi:MAG TPA: ABC transporter permease, partial [Thermoleophilia bacterium]|nr:ABC transporter permease [Thermoleophilia bacterium]
MRLHSVALDNLRRRKARAGFLVAGLLIGIATVVTLLTVSSALTVQAQNNLESFGANIVVAPRSDKLSVAYGGVAVGDASLGAQEIKEADLAGIKTIPNRENIAAVAPELLGVVDVRGTQALLMGVRPDDQFRLKRWWSLDGRRPGNGHEVVAGS